MGNELIIYAETVEHVTTAPLRRLIAIECFIHNYTELMRLAALNHISYNYLFIY